MARTVYFIDGSREVLLCGDGAEAERIELERILRERLGDDAVDLFQSVSAQVEPLDGYELACDAYRACLNDVLAGIKDIKSLLEMPRSDRRRILRDLDRIIKRINNEL